MHYTLKTVPNNVKKLSIKLQKIWVIAFNNAIKQKDNTEQEAFKSAWHAVNNKRGHKADGTKYLDPNDVNKKKEEENKMEKSNKDSFECECVDCGYKETSDKHCKDLKCAECGGQMRRASRPGPGKDSAEDGVEAEPVEEDEEEVVEKDNMKNGEFVIQINGEIGWDITAISINEQLEKAAGQDVVFEIASPGGSVFEGVEIFNAIRNYEGKTEARIVGIAASMASYIPLAAEKVLAEDNATYMIHNAWGIAMGDSEEMKEQAEQLESINKLIAQEYVNKTGKSEKEILKLMSDETWLFGDEIKKEGFIDEVIIHDGDKKDKDSSISEAKESFKKTLTKSKENRMKSDLENMKNILKRGMKMKILKMSQFEKWTIDYKNALPDSAFAVVMKEGDKKIRKLPFRDKDGKVDIPHMRNALKILAKDKILTFAQRSSALGKLKEVANKYLKKNKNTISGKIISASISKFESEIEDKITQIKKVFVGLAEGKKPDEMIEIPVKKISLLIQDLESIEESQKISKDVDDKEVEEKDDVGNDSSESSTKGEDIDKSKVDESDKKEEPAKEEVKEDVKDEGSEETKEEGEKEEVKESEEESKFKELLDVCDGYKKELDEKEQIISKMSKGADALKADNTKLTEEISKFKKEGFSNLVKKTAEKISKFKNLAPHETIKLEHEYSKMSEPALEEIGRITESEMFSKLEEPKPTTKSTELLKPALAAEEKPFSKMSKEEQLDKVAKENAKAKGFVE